MTQQQMVIEAEKVFNALEYAIETYGAEKVDKVIGMVNTIKDCYVTLRLYRLKENIYQDEIAIIKMLYLD